MKIVLAVLLNAALLATLLPWLRRQWRWSATVAWRTVLGLGLGLRVLVGLGRNWTLRLDAEFMHGIALRVTHQFWADPVAGWHLLTDAIVRMPITGPGFAYTAVYQSMSNTWFLIKILALFNFASLETGWLNGLYMSVFAFVGCWTLVRKLAEVLPRTSAGAAAVAFLLWPSVWFWVAGVSKEAMLLGSGAWLTARVMDFLYAPTLSPSEIQPRRFGVGWWVGTVVLAAVHFQMRYFFAGPLLLVLTGVALGRGLQALGLPRRRWSAGLALVLVLGAGAGVAPQLSVAFSINKFTSQLVRVYTYEVEHSVGRPHFEYPNLRPTTESIGAHVPVAIANAVTRPWLGESRQPQYVVAGLENALLLLLLAVAVVALVRGRAGYLPFELSLGLGIFCLILAALIGLTTPNLGSLSRYRTELLPFLLLLALQNDYVAAVLSRLGLGVAPPAPNLRQHKSPARPVA